MTRREAVSFSAVRRLFAIGTEVKVRSTRWVEVSEVRTQQATRDDAQVRRSIMTWRIRGVTVKACHTVLPLHALLPIVFTLLLGKYRHRRCQQQESRVFKRSQVTLQCS
jgi:hypothetical protein